MACPCQAWSNANPICSGILNPGRNACVGSGGWAQHHREDPQGRGDAATSRSRSVIAGRRKEIVAHKWANRSATGLTASTDGVAREVELRAPTPRRADPARFIGRRFADPPYFGNVQYTELIDF